MPQRMIFKFGITVIIAVAVIIVYIQHSEPDLKVSKGQGQDEVESKQDSKETKKVTMTSDEGKDSDSKSQGHLKVKVTEGQGTAKSESSKEDGDSLNVNRHDGNGVQVNVQNDPKNSEEREVVNMTDIPVPSSGMKKETNKQDEVHDEDHDDEDDDVESDSIIPVFYSVKRPPKNSIHLAVVACGDRKDETLVLLKSAVLFTRQHLVFHIFTEKELQLDFKEKIEFWPSKFVSRVDYFIYNITFPTGDSAEHWRKLFKPCASQRLFLPVLLTSVDSLIYVDTDILFLRPLEDLWSFFGKFNSTQLVALAPEHEDPAAGWYNRFARHPYYGQLGLNSGVMLMNLTRLRNSSWLASMLDYYKEYKLKIAWGDQDLINIYLHFYPEQVFVYSCEWNYRPDHCMYMSVCKSSETAGISILHGNRRVFHNDKQPAFKAVYDAFKQHRLGDDVQYRLLVQMERNLAETELTRCGKLSNMFMKQIQIYSQNMRLREKQARMEEAIKQGR